jgi:hypothetical protein
MRVSLALTLALLLGFWVTNFAMYFSRMGLRPASVVAYYDGSEADFRPPRSAASMLETTHTHLWLVRFVSPSLAPLKVAGFLGLQGCLGFLLVALAFSLVRGRRAANGAAAASPSRRAAA